MSIKNLEEKSQKSKLKLRYCHKSITYYTIRLFCYNIPSNKNTSKNKQTKTYWRF